ncbi:MAG: aquaporin [Bacilli bacterium]|nr:aquaporin [Bacilli bacterium]MBO6195566.1 aquaporin [Bacilli bacterium]
MRKYIAEFIGTLTLVLFGTGIAVVTGGNIIATSLAFGLAIIASAYVIGDISGCHVNPAVSFAMLLSNKMTRKDFLGYVVAQILGAFAGTGILFVILKATAIGVESLGANGYGSLSAANVTMLGAFILEVVLTFIFIYTILGVTSDEKKSNIAGIVIGLTLTFVHLFGITITGTSVNPARSLAPAVIQGGAALSQVWLFIVAPLLGAALAACVFKYLNVTKKVKRK